MKYACATTIPVKITHAGRVYFPLTQKLDGKKIYTLILVNCTPTDGSREASNLDNQYENSITLNLTENGTYYPIKDLTLSRINVDTTRGINVSIDKVLNIQACYLYVPESVFSQVKDLTYTLVAFYEQPGYSAPQSGEQPRYTNFEIPLSASHARNYFPDDRTLNGRAISRIYCDVAASDEYNVISPSNNISANNLKDMRITLVRGSFEVWDRIPASLLLQNYWLRRLHLNNIVFDFQSSYIEIFGGAIKPEGATVLNVNVQYQ